jgi:hypothetical protein
MLLTPKFVRTQTQRSPTLEISARRITLTIRRRRILPQPILQTLKMKARSVSVTRSFNPLQSHLAMALASLLQSLALGMYSLLAQPHAPNPSVFFIQSFLPHISLQLGTTSDDPNAPMIRCMVDTGTALNTGNYSFYAAIAKRYPHCIAKVFLPKDYSPIILSGVIDDDAQAITTDLSVAFQFHLPYLTCDGSTTSIIIATGSQVSVNAIIGLPFIKATGMIIDTVDNIVEVKHLVCEPFPIDFCRATKYVPAISDDRAAICYIEFEEVQSIITKTNKYIAIVCASNKTSPSAKRNRITEPQSPWAPRATPTA